MLYHILSDPLPVLQAQPIPHRAPKKEGVDSWNQLHSDSTQGEAFEVHRGRGRGEENFDRCVLALHV